MLASTCGVIAASPMFLAVTCSDVIEIGGLALPSWLVMTLSGLGYGLITAVALPGMLRSRSDLPLASSTAAGHSSWSS